MHEIRNQRAAEEITRHADARHRAEDIWNKSRPAPDDHVYLHAKGIKAHGLRVYAGSLVVPLKMVACILCNSFLAMAASDF